MDDLFELIKALSPSEKRYFKRFAKQHSEDARPKYILLFDAYDALREYDPEILKERIADDRILKYLNQEKKYLKEKLLDCLRVYRGPRTVNGKLFRLLEEAEILNELGLYKQGAKKLETAKQTAIQYDKFSILIQVLSQERKGLLSNNLANSAKAAASEWNRIDGELTMAVKSQEIMARYHKAYLTILRIYRKGSHAGAGPNLYQKKLDELRESDLFQDGPLSNSFAALHLYRLSLSILEQLAGRVESAASIYEDLIRMWEERPDRIASQNRQYILVLANYLNVQHKLEKYDRFDAILPRIRAGSSDNIDDQVEIFQNLAQLDLLYFMNKGIFGYDEKTGMRFDDMQQEIEAGIEKFHGKINPARLLVLYYNLMILNFMVGNSTKANQWMILIDRSEYAKKVRQEILDFCKVFQLMLLYDLENYDLIPHFHKNNKRFLERKDRLNDFYLISLNLIHKLSGVAGKKAIDNLLSRMLKKLSQEVDSAGTADILGSREILLWIRHHLENKTMIELVQEERNAGTNA